MTGGSGFLMGSNINEEMKFTSPRGGSFMVKKDRFSLEQNIDNNPTYIKTSTQQFLTSANTTTTSPINFSATSNIPFPGEKQQQPLQINTLKRKAS